MPAQRKRKNVEVEDQRTSKQARTAKTQKSISTFSNVAKANTRGADKKQSKKIIAEVQKAPSQPSTKAEKKRKRARDAADEDDDVLVVSSRQAVQSTEQAEVLSTPRNKRAKKVAPPSPHETPTRGTLALFDKLNIDANARAIPCALSEQTLSYSTPPHTPRDERADFNSKLPAELEELQDLNSAFIAALAFYYSHNGSASPVNMQTLLPQVSQKFKKRNVKVDDLRRVLAIVEAEERMFSIQDYGRAGVCLAIVKPLVSSLGRPALNIDVLGLMEQFDDAIEKSWREWLAGNAKENRSIGTFMNQLPLLEITKNESAARAAPLFARGQQRLADLKAGQAMAKQGNTQEMESVTSMSRTLQATQNRGTALLDRILAKQSMSSSLPAGLTKDQLERKSALHRIEDVARILSLIVGTKDRCSVSLPTVTQQLQQSLRNPISKDEVERCLGLMAGEIVPNFVRVVQSGDVKGVVITRGGIVGLSELRARVEKACL